MEPDLFNQDMIGLSGDERVVWGVVRERQGRKRAIAISTIAHCANMTKKRVQAVISDLVKDHGKMIGSAYSHPTGVFVITDQEELEKECRQLRSRAMKCLVRASKLKQQAVEEVFKQSVFEFENGV